MMPFRKGLALFVILVIVGAHGALIITDREIWPFSSYQMYSRIERKQKVLVRYRYYGVTNAGTEIALYQKDRIFPFDVSRLNMALSKIARKSAAHPDLYDKALKDVLERYEKRRAQNRHTGPPLDAIRLYEVTWTINPQASNRENPDEKKLIAQWPKQEGVSWTF